jgi:hypothetical protein
MNQYEETTSSVSDWIPGAPLDGEESRAGAPVPADGDVTGEHRRDRWRSSRRRVIVAGSVALAVACGIGIRLVASGSSGQSDSPGGAGASPPGDAATGESSQPQIAANTLIAAQPPRVPAVVRLANLGPSQAAGRQSAATLKTSFQ